MTNNKEIKTPKAEETKVEATVRTRAPNKTKADKLAEMDAKIKIHEDFYKRLEAQKAEMVKDFDQRMAREKALIDKQRAERKAIEEKPERLSKSQRKAELRAKLESGAKLSKEEMDFLFS